MYYRCVQLVPRGRPVVFVETRALLVSRRILAVSIRRRSSYSFTALLYRYGVYCFADLDSSNDGSPCVNSSGTHCAVNLHLLYAY